MNLLKFNTVGVVEEIIFNETEQVSADFSLSWMVKDRESGCIQLEPLTHGLLVSVPSVVNHEHQGQVTDVISVLQSGSTLCMVRYVDTEGTFAYQTYAVRMYGVENNLQEGISTWLPGGVASHMLLRVHVFDVGGDTDFDPCIPCTARMDRSLSTSRRTHALQTLTCFWIHPGRRRWR